MGVKFEVDAKGQIIEPLSSNHDSSLVVQEDKIMTITTAVQYTGSSTLSSGKK